MLESNKYFRKEHVKYIVEKCYDSCLKIIKNDKREEENMFTYDTATGGLKFDMGISDNIKPAIKFETKAEDYPYPIVMLHNDTKNMLSLNIKDYNVLCPSKIVRVDFSDNTSEKMVLHEGDTFDIRTCLYIAMAKHMYKKEYTLEGIEYKAKEFSMKKHYVKMVENVIKEHDRKENEKEKRRIREKEEAERIARKREKNRKERKRKYIEEQIYIQSEAIKTAMKDYKK